MKAQGQAEERRRMSPAAEEKLRTLHAKRRKEIVIAGTVYLCLKHPDIFPEEAAAIEKLLEPELRIIDDVILEADPTKDPDYADMEREIDKRIRRLEIVRLQEKIRSKRGMQKEGSCEQ